MAKKSWQAFEDTRYSGDIGGDDGNYHWPIKLDINKDGYLGINQWGNKMDRILLSPEQVQEIISFVQQNPPEPKRK